MAAVAVEARAAAEVVKTVGLQTQRSEVQQLNLLVLEDDESVARLLQQATEEAGYSVRVVDDGYAALCERSMMFYIELLIGRPP